MACGRLRDSKWDRDMDMHRHWDKDKHRAPNAINIFSVARGQQGGEQSGLALAPGASRQGRLIVAQTPDAIWNRAI